MGMSPLRLRIVRRLMTYTPDRHRSCLEEDQITIERGPPGLLRLGLVRRATTIRIRPLDHETRPGA